MFLQILIPRLFTLTFQFNAAAGSYHITAYTSPIIIIEHINPQIAKLSRDLRTGWYIFGVSNSPKMVYFRVWDSDQHSDPTITLPLESPPPPRDGSGQQIIVHKSTFLLYEYVTRDSTSKRKQDNFLSLFDN